VIRSPRGFRRALLVVAAAFVAAVSGIATAAAAPATTTATTPPSSASAVSMPPRARDDRVLVRMKPGFGAPRGARSISSTRTADGHGDVHLVAVPRGKVSEEITRLRRDPAVEVAQPDHVYSVSATKTPNDPVYPYQWALPFINAPQAWSTATGDGSTAGPVVAVLDTGIDYNHPDLTANVWSNPGGIGNCAAGTHGFNLFAAAPGCDPMDDEGHGTHVAGTIGARGNNAVGVAGVNWQARVMAVKLLDNQGNGDDFSAIAAIKWVVDAKAHGVNVKVINASWGGVGKDQALDDEITNAWNAGILFVAAAGNEGANNDSPTTFQDPCGAPHVLCVAAHDQQGRLASFSNFGATNVALAAPGVGIASTWPTWDTQFHGYATADGTSMASPHVAGAAALLASVCPGFGAAQLRARLLDVPPDPALQGRVATGGHLDLFRALNGAASLSAVQNGTSATLAWSTPCGGGSGYRVTVNGTQVAASAQSGYTISNLAPNANYVVSVTPTNPPGPSATVNVTPLGGGYVLDGWGGLHGFASAGPAPPATAGGPYWAGWSIARGVALLPSGSGGYVLDAYGGLHPFAVGSGPAPPAALGGSYWNGWDIARGVTILNDGTGGYVIDGYGGLHPFAVGAGPMPPPVQSPSYWLGWDIVRGVAVVPSPGSGPGTTPGGYVLDGFGGMHPFIVGFGPAPGTAVGGSYWSGWDIARGVTVAHDPTGTDGLVTDGWGGLHGWATGSSAPPATSGGPYWAGWSVARGVAL
jgi:subtilisin family serine protease